MKRGIRIEVCVDSPAGLEVAVARGADRIELCARLDIGGVTPSPNFMGKAAGLPVEVRAMIRPRGGDFVYSSTEVDRMLADMEAARALGLAGVVFGAAKADGQLDEVVLARLLAQAKGMGCTLHRVIDDTPDPVAATAIARDLGFDTVLSSGGAATAPQGLATLAAMVATPGITVMPGAGLTRQNANGVCTATRCRWIHGSFRDGLPMRDLSRPA